MDFLWVETSDVMAKTMEYYINVNQAIAAIFPFQKSDQYTL